MDCAFWLWFVGMSAMSEQKFKAIDDKFNYWTDDHL